MRRESEVLRQMIHAEREKTAKVIHLTNEQLYYTIMPWLKKPIVCFAKQLGPADTTPLKGSKGSKRQTINSLLVLSHLYTTILSQLIPPPYETYFDLSKPSPPSPIPPLLLHRFLTTSITTLSTLTIPETRAQLAKLNAETRSEEASLKETEILAGALQRRIDAIEEALVPSTSGGSQDGSDQESQTATKILRDLESKRVTYTQAQRRFLRELSKFVKMYIAPMVAVEGLGGPVVGEEIPLDATGRAVDVVRNLQSGRSGRVARAQKKEVGMEKGQQTIHSMFQGKKRGLDEAEYEVPREEEEQVGEEDESDDGSKAPVHNAAKEIKALLEELMNATMSPNQYILLPEGDSATARFLVRANVALFHPRDARKIRLVDFGKSIED